MARHGVFLVCDLLVRERYATRGRSFGYAQTDADEAARALEFGMASLRLAHASGVRIALGTEYGGQPILPPYELADGLALMMDAGLPAVEAIRAATVTAAAVLGWDDRVGRLQAGLLADLIAVRGDPLADIRVLREPVLVVQGGRPIPPDIGQWPHDAPVPFRMLQLDERGDRRPPGRYRRSP